MDILSAGQNRLPVALLKLRPGLCTRQEWSLVTHDFSRPPPEIANIAVVGFGFGHE